MIIFRDLNTILRPIYITSLSLLGAISLTGCNNSSVDKQQVLEQIKEDDNSKERLECTASLIQKKAEYQNLLTEHKYWEAAGTLRYCSEILADPFLNKLVSEAEVKSHLQEIKNPKTPLREKIRAIEMLSRDYPDQGKQYASLLPSLTAQAKKQDDVEEQKAKRRDQLAKKRLGVSIGMTKEEVLASSWGKPQSVNRTTTAGGTHEQWVYGGQNYLYFDSDKLTSIQN